MVASVSFQVEQCLGVILDDGSHSKNTALGVNIHNPFRPVDAPANHSLQVSSGVNKDDDPAKANHQQLRIFL
jgi:hypothetical protein